MFMVDMQGTLEVATRSSRSRTPGERYCGSCMATPTRSSSFRVTPTAPPAVLLPGRLVPPRLRIHYTASAEGTHSKCRLSCYRAAWWPPLLAAKGRIIFELRVRKTHFCMQDPI